MITKEELMLMVDVLTATHSVDELRAKYQKYMVDCLTVDELAGRLAFRTAEGMEVCVTRTNSEDHLARVNKLNTV